MLCGQGRVRRIITKVKVAAALAHGRPVVATRPGAGGIVVNEGRALVVADEPREFADAVLGFLKDAAMWQRAVSAWVEAARRLFDPEVVLRPLGAVLKEQAGAARSRRAARAATVGRGSPQ